MPAEGILRVRAYPSLIMKRSLRKSSELICINFLSGSFSKLFAQDFEVEANEHGALFSFDLSYNQRRDKTTDNYTDADELLRNYEKVNLVQVNSNQVAKGLEQYRTRFPDAQWTLEMAFSDNVKHRYPVELDNDCKAFTVNTPKSRHIHSDT